MGSFTLARTFTLDTVLVVVVPDGGLVVEVVEVEVRVVEISDTSSLDTDAGVDDSWGDTGPQPTVISILNTKTKAKHVFFIP